MGVQHTLEILNYTAPAVILLYWSITTAVSLTAVRISRDYGRKSPRRIVVTFMLLIATTYVFEAGLIISQLFNSNGALITKDRNIHALASALEWSFFSGFVYLLDLRQWYPYYGVWSINLASEVTIWSLSASYFRPANSLQQAQILIPALRIILFIPLPIVLFRSKVLRLSNSESKTDEESTPLLAHAAQNSEDPNSSSKSARYGSQLDKDRIGSPLDNESEDEDEEAKAEREDHERFEKKLQESGSWWAYARRFLVFAPYIWPTGKPRLQFNVFAVAACLTVGRGMNILVPRQLGITVDALSRVNGNNPFLALALYATFSLIGSQAGVGALKTWFWIPIESHATHTLDVASYNHIMGLSCNFHDNKQSGELYMAMRQGHSVVDLLEALLYDLAPVLIDIVVACFYISYLFDAYMLLIVGTTVATYLCTSGRISALASHMRRTCAKKARREFQVLFDTMSGWRTVSYFNMLAHAKESYSTSNLEYLQSVLKLNTYFCFYHGVQDLILDIGLYSACFLAVYSIIYGKRTVGDLITLLTYWASLAGPLSQLSTAHRRLLSNLIDAEQLLELFNTKAVIEDGPNKLHLDKGSVDFNHVSFSYDGEKKIINDVSFTAVAGKTVALIGETGGGKSTILKLLSRFYDPTEGAILIDGQDIRTVTLHSLRENIGVVPQDPMLFNDTILSNLRYAKLNATDNEIIEACKSAAVHDKIVGFTKGYMSKVGEQGVRLSGGELQRVAIARAILKNPKIILLDEATSSVDSETEEKIQQALDKLSKGRTTFIVAHRLSTVKNADLIIVIKDGSVLEQGPPAELLATKGKYYTLWMKQMGIVENPAEAQGNETAQVAAGSDPSMSRKENIPNENGVLQKENEAKGNGIRGKPENELAGGKKIFRPEAPEFIPQSRLSSTSRIESRSRAALTNTPGQEALPKLEKDKKPHYRKRKVKQDTPDLDDRRASSQDIRIGLSIATQPATTDGAADEEVKGPETKRSRPRRTQTKSEPVQPRLERSSADGANEIRNTKAPSSRQVSAPVGPQVGSSLLHGSQSRRPQRHRQRHWRDKSHDASGTSRTTSGAPSTAVSSDEWANDAPGRRGSIAPHPSPATEPVEREERKSEGGGTVRFADGS